MKNTLLTLITLVTVLVTSCGDTVSTADLIASGDLEAIRARKTELADKEKALSEELALIEAAISSAEGDKNLPLVTVFKVNKQKFEHHIDLQGDVTTRQNVLVYPEMPGLLVKVNVIDGQKVQKGQLLAVIEDGGMSSQLAQMETQLALAKTTFERQEKLWKQKIGSEIQYLQAKASYEAQESAVVQMRSQLKKFRITAPFTGIVDDVIREQGTVVSPGPGSEIFRIINLSDMYLEVSVPETHIANITVGKAVDIYFPILDLKVKSKVRQTGNFINPNNRSYKVEIEVPNKNGAIKPNMTARVAINDYTNEEAILIPQSVISENSEGEQYAFVVSEVDSDNLAQAAKNIIKTGKTQGDYVEVLSGITQGMSVIQEGARSVKDGQKVQILKK